MTDKPTGDVAEALGALDSLDTMAWAGETQLADGAKELRKQLYQTIRRALTQQTSPKGFFSFMGVKICDITDENFDAVNMLNKAVDLMNNPNQPKQKVLGDVEAAIMAVEKWKFMQRAGGYKHEDVLNKAYDVLNNHGLAIRTALGAQQPDVNAELLDDTGLFCIINILEKAKVCAQNIIYDLPMGHNSGQQAIYARNYIHKAIYALQTATMQESVNAELLEALKDARKSMLDSGYNPYSVIIQKCTQAITRAEQQQPANAEIDLDNAREVFENWLTGNGNYPHLKHKSFGGQYLHEEAAMKWDGFKAGYYARAEQKGK